MPVLLTPEWWSALAAIVVIDIVLAGDNGEAPQSSDGPLRK